MPALLAPPLLALSLALLTISPAFAQEREHEKAGAAAAPAGEADAGPAGEAGPAGGAAPGGEGHEGGHAEKGTAQILSQTAWAILSFLVVLAILLKKLFPPIVKAMDKRAGDIRDALAAADRARAEAQEMMARHEESLEKARMEAAAIIEEGKSDAQKVKDSILASAKQDAEEMAARARREIEQAKTAAIDDLTRRSIQLSLELSSRLIRKNLSEGEQQGLIQETIRGLPAA